MEEYFLEFMKETGLNHDKDGRLYIPSLWTNFQTNSRFQYERGSMQMVLDRFISDFPCEAGYFTVVQHDDGPMLTLPKNTKIYGACNGNIPLPLIYEDVGCRLERMGPRKTFHEKKILCSFVGSITHQVRQRMLDMYKKNAKFLFSTRTGWTNEVQSDHQSEFIDNTMNSKFALAPRGYGKSSFRFFEIFHLGTIPVYVWDDKEWLPYKDILDYDKFSISIHVDELDILDEILLNVNEKKYNKMLEEYEKIKHMFTLEYMCKYVTGLTNIPIMPENNITFSIEIPNEINVLLVAISIGEQYLQMYNRVFRKSHQEYANAHGYDFEVLTEYIDPTYQSSKMSIYFQKLLVCSKSWKKDYDFIIFVDSDILIHPEAPAIHLSYSYADNIGIVNEYSQPTPELRLQIQKAMGWERSATEYYKLCEFDLDTDVVLNSGVLVMQPRKHREFLENIYHRYLPKSIYHSRGPHFEQTSLGYELQKTKKYVIMSNKWNAIWGLHKMCGGELRDFYKNNYFTHFAGNTDIELAETLY